MKELPCRGLENNSGEVVFRGFKELKDVSEYYSERMKGML